METERGGCPGPHTEVKMKKRILMIMVVFAVLATGLTAAHSYTFLKNGKYIKDTLMDMSRRTGKLEYHSQGRVHWSQVWMINFENNQWNFPNERNQLTGKADGIFLRNGQVMHAIIIDFSSRRRVFEFQQGGSVHESQVARIYFCCDILPGAYNELLRSPGPKNNWHGQGGNNDRYSTSFLVDGRIVEDPLSYLNSRKAGFMEGLQINTHDLWMINFENNQWNFPNERNQLGNDSDTIIMNDGEVIHARITGFSKTKGTFTFQDMDPIHESYIKRIYFCCQVLPEAFKRRGGKFQQRNRNWR